MLLYNMLITVYLKMPSKLERNAKIKHFFQKIGKID